MTPDDTLRHRAGTTQRATVNRIVAIWNRATDAEREEGAQWYPLRAAEIRSVADLAGVDHVTAMAVTAHLSPRTPWGRNFLGLQWTLAGRVMPGLLGRNLQAAMGAMNSADPLGTLRGPKVKAFAANLLGDHEQVTVDVWAARIAFGVSAKGFTASGRAIADDPEKVLGRSGVYAAIAHCYRLAARRVGVSPATMQATTWIVARNGRHL